MADGSQRRRRIQRSQRFSHRFLNHFFNEELVAKTRLELGGVNVHVDGVAGKIEKQQQ